ncbi:MAG: transglutaminase domain-containing protein, partial [Oscillospiraceae bacterium]
PTPADFPSEVEVVNIDGSTTVRKVNYERTHVDWFEFSWDEYDYTIEGTYIYGSVGFDEDIGEAPAAAETAGETGNVAPADDVDKTPDLDVETIIPTEDGAEYDAPLVEAQSENTKKHVETANSDTVANAPEGIYVNADNAEEEWLALNMINGCAKISVEAFPSLQNPYNLVDVFYKVYYQNPYMMGITSFSYDYNTLTLSVNYSYDSNTAAAKQAEIAEKASRVVSETVTDDMPLEQKIEALYNYLVNNSVYDREALEEAEKNDFLKVEGSEFEDAFNAYGVLVKGKGVCMSYAYAFRLLCDLSGVDCVVVTGYLNGNLPHAWNMVSLGGKWYEIDCTNNAVNTGIPYYLYQADSSLARTSGYTKDEMFALDKALPEFEGNDAQLEYYRSNGLCPETIEEYSKLLTENVTPETEAFAVRWQGEINRDEFVKAVILAYNMLGMEDKLETLRYSISGGFIVIVNSAE